MSQSRLVSDICTRGLWKYVSQIAQCSLSDQCCAYKEGCSLHVIKFYSRAIILQFKYWRDTSLYHCALAGNVWKSVINVLIYECASHVAHFVHCRHRIIRVWYRSTMTMTSRGSKAHLRLGATPVK